MTQPLPPELQAIAQHYAQTPGSGVPAPAPHQAYPPAAQAPQANPYAPPTAAVPPPPAPALAAITPPPGYYRASDGRDYPIPAHLTQPNDVRPETVYAPPQAAAPAAPPAPNPYAPPAHVVPALIANQVNQPLPINPPEVVAALDPNAPPPAERKPRQRKQKADAQATAAAVVADAAPAPSPMPGTTLDDALNAATTEVLLDELAFRGYVVQLTRPLGDSR